MILPKLLLTVLLMLVWNAPLLAATSVFVPSPSVTPAQTSNSINHALTAEDLEQEAEQLLVAGKYGQARVKFLDAIRLRQQAHQTTQAAQGLLQLADRDRRADRWQDALECYQQLLQLKPLSAHTKTVALNSLAQVYAAVQQFSLALEYYQQALTLSRQIKDPAEQITALLGLASVYTEQGHHAPSRAHLQEAQRLEQRAGNTQAEAATLQLLGRSDQVQKRWAAAQQTLMRALTLQRQIGDQVGAAQSLCWLSEIYLAREQRGAALDAAEQAVTLAKALKNDAARWRAYLALARSQRALERTQEAIKSYDFAIAFIEKQRLLNLSADALKITFLAERQAPYREQADLLLATGDDKSAFHKVEYARGRATLDLLAQKQRPPTREPSASRPAELATADRQTQFLLPITLKQAQEMMGSSSSVLLEFFLGEPRSYVWLISAEETHWAALPGQKEIEAQLRPYLQLLATKPPGVYLEHALAEQKKQGEQLFTLLLGPLAEKLKPEQRLVIVPDGLLYYLPFETLQHDGRYLIEDHEVHYAPSASTLRLLQQAPRPPAVEGSMELLAFGDPVFSVPSSPKSNGKSQVLPELAMNTLRASGSFRLPPLPYTRQEVLAISQAFPQAATRTFLGAEATKAVLKHEQLGRYRRLHFATHSLIDEQLPARSGVLLALDKDSAEDGFLDMAEISQLPLACDLVVLSACRTGRGQLVSGEGIVGLVRAFLYAGSRAVAVSLWDVSDVSTARLMEQFYHHLAAPTETAEALRQAKLEMLHSDQVTRHPYYWAPFVLVGQPR